MRRGDLRCSDLGNRRQGGAQIPPNPQMLAAGGTLHYADTIEAVAEAAGLPPENLAATVVEYNNAVRFNRLVTLLPERSTRSGAPRRIETPPFFAIPICAARYIGAASHDVWPLSGEHYSSDAAYGRCRPPLSSSVALTNLAATG
jgi:hypothetical protein